MESVPLPKIIAVSPTKDHRAVFTIEPLYPGYGMTVGNSLRRVLMSSLPGAAITSVKFEGVNHEFSTLPYIKEDVVEIILNLKQVRLRLHGDGPTTVNLLVHGAKAVTAGDISATSDVEIANPKQHIATLTDKAAKLELELTIGRGRGYVPVENREKEKLEIGTIAIDAVYSPIKNVNFTTEHVRVEQITNFDRLILEVTTDGTISPTEAVSQASDIMVQHFRFVAVGAIDNQETPAAADDPATDEIESDDDQVKPKKKSRKKKSEESSET